MLPKSNIDGREKKPSIYAAWFHEQAQRNKCGQRIALRRFISFECVCFIVEHWICMIFLSKNELFLYRCRLRIVGKCKWNQFREYDHWSWQSNRRKQLVRQSLGEWANWFSKHNDFHVKAMIFHHLYERSDINVSVAFWLIEWINMLALQLNDLKRTSLLWLWQRIVFYLFIFRMGLVESLCLLVYLEDSSLWHYSVAFRTRKSDIKEWKNVMLF